MNKVKNKKYQKNKENKNNLCRFFQDPSNDCYYLYLDNQKMTRKATYYCMENYQECVIYERLLKEENPLTDHLVYMMRNVGMEI